MKSPPSRSLPLRSDPVKLHPFQHPQPQTQPKLPEPFPSSLDVFQELLVHGIFRCPCPTSCYNHTTGWLFALVGSESLPNQPVSSRSELGVVWTWPYMRYPRSHLGERQIVSPSCRVHGRWAAACGVSGGMAFTCRQTVDCNIC